VSTIFVKIAKQQVSLKNKVSTIVEQKALVVESAETAFLHLERVQLMQLVRDAAIREVVLGRQMQLVQVVLVMQLLGGSRGDPLRAVMCVRIRVAVHRVAVHLRAEADELGDFLAARLVLELADHLFIQIQRGK